MEITTFGAIIGLIISIFLIIKKIAPVYSLLFGVLLGGLIGGASLIDTVNTIIKGTESMMPSVIRIISSGILAGVLIQSGAANKIAQQIINRLGEHRALLALALSTMILTAVGVFIDVAVITVAPIGMALAQRLKFSNSVILLALIGGGKAGNVISPNPNTIATAENFGVDLAALMLANLIPALFALTITIIIATILSKKQKSEHVIISNTTTHQNLPDLIPSITGPFIVILLLSLRPLASITIDPLIALPSGGIVGAVAMRKTRNLPEYMHYGLSKMMPVAILLIGTGAIAGIIKASNLQYDTIILLNTLNLPGFLLAPISGILMGGATASTTAGASIASATFAPTLTQMGVSPISGGAMVHAGATVIDSLPHGSFFHSTAGAGSIDIMARMKLIPYEIMIGLTTTVVSTIMWGIFLA